MASSKPTFGSRWLWRFRKRVWNGCRNIGIVERSSNRKYYQRKQHVHVCYQCKQHVHVHVQNLQFVISADKATFQREKCLAMLYKQWTMSSVRPSNSGCTWIVERALTLPSCSPNYPIASRIGWTHARHCPFLKWRFKLKITLQLTPKNISK